MRREAVIAKSLDAIERHLARLARPTRLAPGVPRTELASRRVPFAWTAELRALYRARNGTITPPRAKLGELWLFPGFYLLTLDEAVTAYREQRRSRRWKKSWVPVLADGAGDFFAASPRGVIGFMAHEPEQKVEYESLAALFAAIADGFARRAFYVKGTRFEIDDAKWGTDDDEDDREGRERAAAIELATKATQLMRRGQVWKSLPMFEQALEVGDLHLWVYVNALYAVMPDNNKHPLDRRRIRRMVERCLPMALREPDIHVNAAFAYAHLDEPKLALAQLRAARKRGVNLARYLAEPLLEPLAARLRAS